MLTRWLIISFRLSDFKLKLARRHRLEYKICRSCGARNSINAEKCRKCRSRNLRLKKRGGK